MAHETSPGAFERLRDRSPVAVLSASAEGAITGWSPEAERFLQYSAAEITGRAFPSLAPDPSAVEQALDQMRRSSSVYTVCLRTPLTTKDGEAAPAFVCVDAVRDGEGHVEGFLITLRDLRTVVFEPDGGERARLAVPDAGALKGLTPRQRVVLELIARGYSTREIAKRLSRSVKTIETHRAQLMKRLNIYHVPGLVGFAIRAGLVMLE